MGFGNLLQIRYQVLSKNLLVELMERWSSDKHAFWLVPGEIAITLMDVALILGLRVTGDPVILREDEPFSDLEREYGAAVWNRNITITSIEERLDSLGEIVNEDFIRSFLLFIFGTLLFPWNRKITITSIEERLDSLGEIVNEDFIRSFLLFIFGTLLFPNANGKVNSRFSSLLQRLDKLWSYEHIDIARLSLLNYQMTFPCACRWGNSKSHHRQWFTTKFKELEKNQIMWKLQLTSEESKMDTIKELLEAQCDGNMLPALRYKEDNVRTRLQIMDQWIAELPKESEMDIVRDVHGEDCFKVPMILIEDDDILSTFHNLSEVERECMVHPWTSEENPSTTIIISDEDEEDNLRGKDQILQEKNVKLRRQIDDLRKENKLLKNQLLPSSAFEKKNVNLRKKVENLRRENNLLMLSSHSLVARLERLIFDENVSATEEESSAPNGNEDYLFNP